MKIITSFGLFLTSEWIWAVTFARSHVLLSMPILLITFLVIGKMRLTSAIMYAFFAPIFALSTFTFLVHGVIDRLFGIKFIEMQHAYVVHPFVATFLLTIIYIVFQWLFFKLLSYCYRLPVQRYTCAAAIGNLIAMFIVYKFLPPL